MDTEIKVSNDTLEKFRKLLGSINGIKSTRDLYSICISNVLNNGLKG